MAEASIPAPNLTLDETAVAPQSLDGWSTFQFAVNVLLPRYLRDAETIRQDTLRLLRGI